MKFGREPHIGDVDVFLLYKRVLWATQVEPCLVQIKYVTRRAIDFTCRYILYAHLESPRGPVSGISVYVFCVLCFICVKRILRRKAECGKVWAKSPRPSAPRIKVLWTTRHC